jgi:hypothetical protein
MIKKIIAMLVLGLSTMFASAGVVTLKNFDLIWYEGTNEHGGLAKVFDLDLQVDTFQVWIGDFSKAYDSGEHIDVEDFITPLIGGNIFFENVHLFGVFGKEKNEFLLNIGTGYSEDSAIPFLRTQFREYNGNNWTVSTDTAAVPEPATWMMLIPGISIMIWVSRRKELSKTVRYTS